MGTRSFKKLLQISGVVLGFAMLAIGIGTALNLNTGRAAASDCSPNSIVTCGFSSASNFIDKVRTNTPGDLPAIYSSYGLTSADYNRFVTSARPGTAFKDGRIVVDGQVVATNAQSIGRSQKPGDHAKTIGGKTYWEGRAQDVFASNSLPVLVLFDSQGKMQFAVMTDCGNPTNGTPSTPTFACNDLNRRQVNRTTYAFSTNASAGNGASINHVVYDFGDGTSVSKTNPAEEVTHTYAKDGTFTAKVTVYVNVPGAQTAVVAPAGNCVKQVTVTPAPPTPVASCTNLTVTMLERTKFRLSASATTSGGASISRYSFTVKDSGGRVVASPAIPTSASTASADVSLNAPGTYSAQVLVTTSVGPQSGAACTKNLTVAQPPTATCRELAITPLDRTTYKLSAAATTANGAVVQGYDFTVKDSDGKSVAAATINSAALAASANVTVSQAGKYTAQVTVRTSAGPQTGSACTVQLTVPEKPIPPVPSVKIEKTVDGVKSEQVGVGQVFTYQIVVTNDGKVNLKKVAVTDQPMAGLSLQSADLGTVAGNAWSYEIPSLNIGQSVRVNLTATVTQFTPGNLDNTACVNAPEVNPTHPQATDMCDVATVTVVPPASTPTPTPTTELPNTGAGNVIGIFAATVIASGLGSRFFIARKLSRRA